MYSYRDKYPRMAGVIIKEKIKCGKPGCKCARGKLHKWYYYLYYREWDGKRWRLRKEYVPRRKVKALRRKIQRWKERDSQRRRDSELRVLLLRVIIRGVEGSEWAYRQWLVHREDFDRLLDQVESRKRKKATPGPGRATT